MLCKVLIRESAHGLQLYPEHIIDVSDILVADLLARGIVEVYHGQMLTNELPSGAGLVVAKMENDA